MILIHVYLLFTNECLFCFEIYIYYNNNNNKTKIHATHYLLGIFCLCEYKYTKINTHIKRIQQQQQLQKTNTIQH